jgi:hypothetical protein
MKLEKARVVIALIALLSAILLGVVGMSPRRVMASGPACECMTIDKKSGIEVSIGCIPWECTWITE